LINLKPFEAVMHGEKEQQEEVSGKVEIAGHGD
jgi:hypothetical protein